MNDLIPQEQGIVLNDEQSTLLENMEECFAVIADTLDDTSVRVYRNGLHVFLIWLFEGRRELNRRSLAAYRHYLSAKYKKTTAKRMWSVVYRTLEEMVQSHHLKEHPARGIRGFQAQGNYTKHIALEKKEAIRLLNAVPITTKKGKRDYAILLTLLYTGLRRSECASLTKGQLREAQGHHVFVLEEMDTKSGEPALVKVPAKVWRAIMDYLESSARKGTSSNAPLFAAFHRGDRPIEEAISGMVIYRVVKEYAKLAGLDKLLPHGMRASFVTLSIDGGAPLHKVARDARHKDSRMTEHYYKRKQDLDKSAADYIELEGEE